MYLLNEFSLIPFLILLTLWAMGGTLIIARQFYLPGEERIILGLALGMFISNWLANWLARILPLEIAFWGAALLTVALGAALAWPIKRELFPPAAIQPGQWAIFLLLTFAFILMGRGLGIFDDYQNLPPVSTLAAGDIPPHFAFQPDLRWGYHYFLLLVAAQFVRLTDAGPWTAFDLARGLSQALALMLVGFLAYRMTRSRLAQGFSMLFFHFTGGARWILYLLPASLMNRLSSSVTMIGSGADTGVNLNVALYKNWDIQGLGPIPFPFVFGSGLDPSFSMAHNGIGASAILIIAMLLLLYPQKQDARASLPLVILFASLALANEVIFVFIYLGLGLAALSWVIRKRNLRLPAPFWHLTIIMFIAGLFSLVEGGIITEVLRGRLEQATTGQSNTLYQVTFRPGPPQFISAHLGNLSLLNPLQWIAILAETGLAVFALPLVLKYALEQAREEDWLITAWMITIFISLGAIFIQYTGNAGPTALSRLQAHFLTVIKFYAIPLLWLWLKNRSESWQLGALAWGLATIFSGLGLLGPQLAAMPNPAYGEFLTHLDAKMFQQYWNTLPKDALVFDQLHVRAPTVLGRFTRAATSYGPPTDEWNVLADDPAPEKLLAAGFEYLYYDYRFGKKFGSLYERACIKEIGYVDDVNSGGTLVDYRRLIDLRGCQP